LKDIAMNRCFAACVLAIGSATLSEVAPARTVDKTMPIEVFSKSFSGEKAPQTKLLLHGGVRINQGSFEANADDAEIYTGSDGDITRVVLLGNAYLREIGDDGQLTEGWARVVDYDVVTGNALMRDSARVKRANGDNANASSMQYNMESGAVKVVAFPGDNSRIEVTPKKKASRTSVL
jgi:lipopolysaccharide transport protein LptA